MSFQGLPSECPELAAGEGQNQPQLRIMSGYPTQVNEKKAHRTNGPKALVTFVAPAFRRLSRGHPALARPTSEDQ
jgi:hypothetical protein